MSDTQVFTTFELLPSEVLIECFEYLNGLHIFHSFDQLNYRFNNLIRSVPLHLNFEDIQQSIFHEFCLKLSSNPEMKKHVYSLHLSNKDTCWQIQIFLSRFSLDEFIHLRSLTLVEATKNNAEKLKSMLPSIPWLSCFRMIDCRCKTDDIMSAYPMSELRTLMLSRLPRNFHRIFDLSLITNITTTKCELHALYRILNYASRLAYLNVQCVERDDLFLWDSYIAVPMNPAIHLKQLIIMSLCGNFDDLAMILRQTPNLNSLTISTDLSYILANGSQWKDLITSSLPYLRNFKFKFEGYHRNENNRIEEVFKQFQSDFWQKHHWYTEYFLSNNRASIYTIPYISNTFELKPYCNRYCNELINNIHIFDNVTNLIITPHALTEKCQYHFSNVTSMTLGDSWKYGTDFLFETKHIESLKAIVNLSNVKHLTIADNCLLETTLVLLELLKEAQQVSSLTINPNKLILMFDDNELSEYMSKTIKKLDIFYAFTIPLYKLNGPDQICRVFANIEQLDCKTNSKNALLILIQSLPKLSRLNVYWWWSDVTPQLPWLKEELRKLNSRSCIDYDDIDAERLSIWAIRYIY